MSRRAAPAVALCLGVLVSSTMPAGAEAQGLLDLSAACATAAPDAPALCTEGAVTSRSLMSHVGLLAGMGSEIPGATSALGRRLSRGPRVAVSVRGGGAHVHLPAVTDRGADPSPETSFFVPAVHGSVAVGAFDGFGLTPTVRGFLSLDFVGQTSLIFLPESEGFGERVAAFSFGARVGVIRETFTLPGITLSVSRRLSGSTRLGDAAQGDPIALELDPSVTSLRATVGKDLFAVGLMGGVGWDDYSSSVVLRVTPDVDGTAEARGTVDASRTLFFLGASLNFLILQLSAEGGWARGLSSVSGYEGAPFDPTAGSAFASLAFRLTV